MIDWDENFGIVIKALEAYTIRPLLTRTDIAICVFSEKLIPKKYDISHFLKALEFELNVLNCQT